MLRLVAAVERRSEHPLAEALVAAADARGLPAPEAEDFDTRAGHGASGRVTGALWRSARRGSWASWARTCPPSRRRPPGWPMTARRPLYAAVDGRAAAILAVADAVKDSTPAALEALRALGLRVAMVTGDDRRTAEAVARGLGIEEVAAEVLPEDKAARVEAMRQGGRRVAFVGDGVNDAPALAAADVGIAVGGGTDIAIESADVVLMSGDLGAVADAVGLSRATMRNIRQNLFWAFAYNVVLIPVAALGLLSPALAAGAMALSSVFVLTNALRLRRFQGAHPAGSAALNIGEAAAAAGVSAKRIRHYEQIGLVRPAERSAAGYRTYGETEVHVLRFVARAREIGFSIERIRVLLALWADKERRSAEVRRIALEQAAELESAASAMAAMRGALLHLAEHCQGDDRPECPILDDLARQPAEDGPGPPHRPSAGSDG